MKKFFAIILTLFATSAFAIGLGNDNPGGTGIANQSQNQGQAQGQMQSTNVSNRISNDVRANAAAWAGSVSGSKSNAYNAGNTASLTVNEAPIPTSTYTRIDQSDFTVKNVPNVYGGNVYPTAPCMGSSTVGGAGVGFGFSVGSSWTDDECGIRETSRSFNSMGLKDDALAVLCSSKYAAAAPSCRKEK